jgi:hypothetical protein
MLRWAMKRGEGSRHIVPDRESRSAEAALENLLGGVKKKCASSSSKGVMRIHSLRPKYKLDDDIHAPESLLLKRPPAASLPTQKRSKNKYYSKFGYGFKPLALRWNFKNDY